MPILGSLNTIFKEKVHQSPTTPISSIPSYTDKIILWYSSISISVLKYIGKEDIIQ